MNDYISREAAKEYVKSQNGRPFIGITIGDAFRMMLDEVPATDVVEVVRCGDCKYYFGDGFGECEMVSARLAAYQRDVRWNDDFYCAFGKRKDGGTDNE